MELDRLFNVLTIVASGFVSCGGAYMGIRLAIVEIRRDHHALDERQAADMKETRERLDRLEKPYFEGRHP